MANKKASASTVPDKTLPPELASESGTATVPISPGFHTKRAEIREGLVKKHAEVGKRLRRLICYRRGFLLFLAACFLAYWWFCYGMGVFNLSDGLTPTALLFRVIPLAIVIAILTTPIMWGIRLLSRAIDDHTVLQQDLSSRVTVEEHLETLAEFTEFYGQREAVDMLYLENWLHNNPADRLIQLRHKHSRASDANASQATLGRLLEELRRLITKPTGNTS